MADTSSFTKLVPGFDFLQSLVKNASSALPNMGQWVAPTLDPEELEKRIEELKTVQFWLEQNARLLGATVQALEVQRMTLSTLKTMNVQMGDLRDSLQVRVPEAEAEPEEDAEDKKGSSEAPPAPKPRRKSAKAAEAPPPAVDPMQWWGAITKQFTELAASAIKDSATDAAQNLAGTVIKESVNAAGKRLKKAAAPPAKAPAAKSAAKPAAKRAPAKR